jgi:selenocysteine-specific elongation factor
VIDVPGHERFVRTMVAGATGIDLFLLVIDAVKARARRRTSTSRSCACSKSSTVSLALTKVDAVR